MKKFVYIIFFLYIYTNIEIIDKTLRFDSNHEFTILYLTDLHLENGSKDAKTLNLARYLIKKSNPNLVILGGDIISGYKWNRITKKFAFNIWKKITNIFLEEKVLYAYAFGNHDIEAELNDVQLGKLDKTNPYSVFKGDMAKDPNSTSNYVLKILSNFENRKKETSGLIWIFDSKRHGCGNRRFSYGCINDPQINWYKKESNKINKEQKKNTFGLSFFHIPIYEFVELWNKNKTYGNKNEYSTCPKKNTNIFDAIKKSIKGVYVGHDHDNDFGGFLDGVDLAYNRKTGYASYGKLIKGARVFKLKEFINDDGFTDFQFFHFILEDNGNVIFNGKHRHRNYNKQRFCKRFSMFLTRLMFRQIFLKKKNLKKNT